MKYTGNYNLKKPEGIDAINIDDLNGNADIVDTELKKINTNKVDAIAGKKLSTEDYSTADKNKLAGIATGANNYTHPSTHPASIISQDASNRFVTDAQKAVWDAKASTAVVTTTANGLMSFADKIKLNGVATGANNYTHPTADGNLHVPTTGTTNNGKVLKAGAVAGSAAWATLTKSDVGLSNVENTADINKPVSTAQVNALGLKLDKSSVVNNLKETVTGKALDATQGKVLDEKISNLDKALASAYAPVSYMAFCANVNTESLDAAFGKNNEDRIRGLGLQLAMYAKYKDPTVNINAQFGELIKCNSLNEINNNLEANRQLFDNPIITNLILSNDYAKESVLPTPYNGYIYNVGDEFIDITGGWIAVISQGGDRNTAYADKVASELLIGARVYTNNYPTCKASFNSKKSLNLVNKKIKINYKVSWPTSSYTGYLDAFGGTYIRINDLVQYPLTWYDKGVQGSFITPLLNLGQGNLFIESYSRFYTSTKTHSSEISIQSIELID